LVLAELGMALELEWETAWERESLSESGYGWA
jgi:hypothetical protein